MLEVHDGPHLVDSEVHLKVSNRVGEERDAFGSVYSVKIYNLAQSRGHVLLCAKGRGEFSRKKIATVVTNIANFCT